MTAREVSGSTQSVFAIAAIRIDQIRSTPISDFCCRWKLDLLLPSEGTLALNILSRLIFRFVSHPPVLHDMKSRYLQRVSKVKAWRFYPT